MPFDQFTIEQLAGDLLPDRNLDTLVATGFNRNTLTNREGGTDPEQFRDEQVLDRAATARHRLARPHHRLRPVPRPQVRSHLAEGVLPARRLLQYPGGGEYRGARCPASSAPTWPRRPDSNARSKALFDEYEMYDAAGRLGSQAPRVLHQPGPSRRLGFRPRRVHATMSTARRRSCSWTRAKRTEVAADADDRLLPQRVRQPVSQGALRPS